MREAAAIGIFFVLWAGAVSAHAEDGEHSLVMGIGPAAEWPLRGEKPNYGGSIAAEKEVIENWLELELGVAILGVTGSKEPSTSLLFKKPFRFSPEFEFMVGSGLPSPGRTAHPAWASAAAWALPRLDSRRTAGTPATAVSMLTIYIFGARLGLNT